MFFEINRNLCQNFTGLDPIKLLDYPAEDVFNLINDLISYNSRNEKTSSKTNSGVIRKKAGDDWF